MAWRGLIGRASGAVDVCKADLARHANLRILAARLFAFVLVIRQFVGWISVVTERSSADQEFHYLFCFAPVLLQDEAATAELLEGFHRYIECFP